MLKENFKQYQENGKNLKKSKFKKIKNDKILKHFLDFILLKHGCQLLNDQ
jgi:hypothetical protein